ncbi:sugar ABC transporter permease [Butyrivibrio sp. CB08]|uniref:carbohydrate ABC transporter permease n=1 Tax=Butyrivibrio sp. CB08 TaxID=2364879 RepID=UPI000EA94C20|nr:sugar ABC transporter permease [Butyrivibrio sp. CB08]RKM62167.1 sugar ABC transporter permease [Butyrivibrio sp. CB08]
MRKRQMLNYFYVAPMLLLFAAFIVYPIIYNVRISFFEWNGISKEMKLVGFQNYIELFQDPILIRILINFLVFSFSTIIIQGILGMFFASLMRSGLKMSGLYRTLIYLPIVATPTIVGSVFSKILETNKGYLNEMLRSAHLDSLALPWLATPALATMWVIIVNIWQWTGYSMLVYYTGMLNIPTEVYEAADIDGASRLQRFFFVTFPMLRSTHFTIFIMGMIGSLKTFDIPYVLTGGGPNHATEFFSTYINTLSFETFNQGKASAVVTLMLVIAMAITAVQLRIYYKQEKG